MSMIDALLSLKSKPHEQGEVLGTNASYLSMSNAIGPATAGVLVSVSYAFPFWVASLTLLTAWFALALITKRRLHERRCGVTRLDTH